MTRYNAIVLLVSILVLTNYVESLTIQNKATHMLEITHASDCLQSHLSKLYHMPQKDDEPPKAFLKAFGDLAKQKPDLFNKMNKGALSAEEMK